MQLQEPLAQLAESRSARREAVPFKSRLPGRGIGVRILRRVLGLTIRKGRGERGIAERRDLEAD